MTFNATALNLHLADQAGLVERDLRGAGSKVRKLLVTKEISDLLDGKLGDTGFPAIKADVLMNSFLCGYSLNVSRKKSDKKKKRNEVELEQIEGVDEVWALCFRTPRPGWRIMGRFLQKDVLVLLCFYHKDEIGSSYEPKCSEVTEAWVQKFGNKPPHRGVDLKDYLSGSNYDVDQETKRN